ncbi:MAG: response regulator transcription factor [Spirochaetaceae bacterium]|jgi:DNA-binding NarL/FixJ family response regulator|nr:response regulator transcription factor [Spirochaetaceae bacterium]
MITIIVVDKNGRDRSRTQTIIDSQEDIEIVGIGTDGRDALILAETRKPNIIILDVYSIFTDDIDIIPFLQYRNPNSALFLFASLVEEKYIYKAIRYEVPGFALKNTDPNLLIAGIRQVYRGERFISPAIRDKIYRLCSALLKNIDLAKINSAAQSVPDQNSLPEKISSIELGIMACIARGYSTKEIAQRFCLADGTVRNYLSSGMKKAGLQRRTQIPLFVIRNGLFEVSNSRA